MLPPVNYEVTDDKQTLFISIFAAFVFLGIFWLALFILRRKFFSKHKKSSSCPQTKQKFNP